jgi:hypothetical protein
LYEPAMVSTAVREIVRLPYSEQVYVLDRTR